MQSPRMEPLKSSLKSLNSSMKSHYLGTFILALGLMSALPAFGQASNQKPDAYNSATPQNSEAQMADMHKPGASKAQESDAEKSFDEMKTLAGVWQGRVTVDPPQPDMDNKAMQVTLRVTSRGHSIVHEMHEAGTPDDPSRYDHPVTMFYVDNDRLLLTHYCDAGNRPRMTGTLSADGKQVDFNFLDVAGSTQYGHMEHAVFTAINADHHSEDWTYLMPGDKPMHAHMELTRTK